MSDPATPQGAAPAQPSERRRTVKSGAVRLAVFEQGGCEHGAAARPTILFVHGYPDTHRVWDGVCAALGAEYHLVRYDVRGAGESGAPRGLREYRLDRLSDDLFAVAAAVSPDRPVHVVGHDWGSIQSWDAVTDPRAPGRIASFTTLSGPCLDHVGHWNRARRSRPTPHHLGQLLRQQRKSWYIALFHVPLLAPAGWRLWLGRRWDALLRHAEGVEPRAGRAREDLVRDAVHGIALYRANMLPRLLRPRQRTAAVPVQLVVLRRDRFVGPELFEDLDRWAPRLTRRELDATHWSALANDAATLAALIDVFVKQHDDDAAEGADAAKPSAS